MPSSIRKTSLIRWTQLEVPCRLEQDLQQQDADSKEERKGQGMPQIGEKVVRREHWIRSKVIQRSHY